MLIGSNVIRFFVCYGCFMVVRALSHFTPPFPNTAVFSSFPHQVFLRHTGEFSSPSSHIANIYHYLRNLYKTLRTDWFYYDLILNALEFILVTTAHAMVWATGKIILNKIVTYLNNAFIRSNFNWFQKTKKC